MSADVTKHRFSGSTSGRGVLVVPTGSPGVLIHAAHATLEDEIWIYASNSGASADLTIEFGGTGAGDLIPAMTIEPNLGLVTVIPGLILTAGLEIRAFATAASQVVLWGFVNRIENS